MVGKDPQTEGQKKNTYSYTIRSHLKTTLGRDVNKLFNAVVRRGKGLLKLPQENGSNYPKVKVDY